MKQFWQNFKYHILISLFIIFSLLTPLIFTKISLWTTFNDSDSNIGETIGGITSPFFNILGSLLIFFTLNEQLKEKKENNIKNNCLLFLTHLKETINNYSFSSFFDKSDELKVYGYDALNLFFNTLQITHAEAESLSNEPEVIEVEHLLRFINSTFEIIETLDSINAKYFFNYINTIIAPIKILKSENEFMLLNKKENVPTNFILILNTTFKNINSIA